MGERQAGEKVGAVSATNCGDIPEPHDEISTKTRATRQVAEGCGLAIYKSTLTTSNVEQRFLLANKMQGACPISLPSGVFLALFRPHWSGHESVSQLELLTDSSRCHRSTAHDELCWSKARLSPHAVREPPVEARVRGMAHGVAPWMPHISDLLDCGSCSQHPRVSVQAPSDLVSHYRAIRHLRLSTHLLDWHSPVNTGVSRCALLGCHER